MPSEGDIGGVSPARILFSLFDVLPVKKPKDMKKTKREKTTHKAERQEL